MGQMVLMHCWGKMTELNIHVKVNGNKIKGPKCQQFKLKGSCYTENTGGNGGGIGCTLVPLVEGG